jgi:hypothetical protein
MERVRVLYAAWRRSGIVLLMAAAMVGVLLAPAMAQASVAPASGVIYGWVTSADPVDVYGTLCYGVAGMGVDVWRVAPEGEVFVTSTGTRSGKDEGSSYVQGLWYADGLQPGTYHVYFRDDYYQRYAGTDAYVTVDADPVQYDVLVVRGATVWAITPSAGPGGVISPSTVQKVSPGKSSSTFVMKPAVGYSVADVLVDGVSQGAIASYKFTNVTKNHTIAVSFAFTGHTITPSTGPGGYVGPSLPQVVNDGGDSITFTAYPNPGYHVENLFVDGVSVGAVSTYKFYSVTTDHTITASFAVNTYTVVPSAGPGGSITPSAIQTVKWGANSSTFVIKPAVGYSIADVIVDKVSVGPVPAYKFTSVKADHSISATFVFTGHTITPSTGPGGYIGPSAPQIVNDGGDCATFAVHPNPGYHVVDVLVDGSSVGAIGTYKFTNVTEDHTISATFAIDTFTITPSAGLHGSITPSGVQTVKWSYNSSTFVMKPAAGYKVHDVWVDGVSVGAVLSYKFTGVKANHTISVSFDPLL